MTKRIEAADGKMLLTCQSEGYPRSSVEWQDGHGQQIESRTTAESMPDQRFKVTSEIPLSSLDKNNYTCNFTTDGNSATFHIPGNCFLLGVCQKKSMQGRRKQSGL